VVAHGTVLGFQQLVVANGSHPAFHLPTKGMRQRRIIQNSEGAILQGGGKNRLLSQDTHSGGFDAEK
jgi:hypothetical protein